MITREEKVRRLPLGSNDKSDPVGIKVDCWYFCGFRNSWVKVWCSPKVCLGDEGLTLCKCLLGWKLSEPHQPAPGRKLRKNLFDTRASFQTLAASCLVKPKHVIIYRANLQSSCKAMTLSGGQGAWMLMWKLDFQEKSVRSIICGIGLSCILNKDASIGFLEASKVEIETFR